MMIDNKEGSIEKRYGAYCAYCGWKAESVYYMQLEGSSIARDHAKTCEKHPLRQLERELAEARSALSKAQSERDNLYRCAKFYANGEHAHLDDWEAPDEPNWICPPSEIEGEEALKPGESWDPMAPKKPRHRIDLEESWMVEDGGLARYVLAGGTLPDNMAECEDEAFHLPKDAVPLEAPK